MKTKNYEIKDQFGLFIYDKSTDEFIYGLYFSSKKEAIKIAKLIIRNAFVINQYIEIWGKDENDYYGNCSKPIFKSDI